jgi:hypothetical protein
VVLGDPEGLEAAALGQDRLLYSRAQAVLDREPVLPVVVERAEDAQPQPASPLARTTRRILSRRVKPANRAAGRPGPPPVEAGPPARGGEPGMPFVRDGSALPPRLEVHQALWGMVGLRGDGGREASPEGQVAAIAAAGFTGVLGSVPPRPERPRWRRLLDEHGLAFGALAFPARPEDLDPLLADARDFGAAYVNAQVMDAFVVGAPAVELLRGLGERAAGAGMPFFVETHRGRVTQDLLRTVDYVRRLPELLLTLDLSHYVVAGEVGATSAAVDACFAELFGRTGSIHGRVSNGQQVQVDAGDGTHGPVTAFRAWWTAAMRAWRAAAAPGDVLPFVVELGPPAYAITTPEGREVSDRWAQALVLRRIALECWSASGGA